MGEKVNHGRSKLISSYGGVGSVIDTPDASIIIETFDEWGYPAYYDKEIGKYVIIDDRLLNRLRVRFPKLKQLVSIPIEREEKWKSDVQPQANYFPKWFYCPRCKRFMHYKHWKKHWVKGEFNLQCFDPKCKGEKLEQIRFIMTCNNGHIQDLPWEFWNNREQVNDDKIDNQIEDVEIESKSRIKLKYEKCCSEQELYYYVSSENTDLSGIHIKCKKCGKSETLKGIFNYSQKCSGQKYWLGMKDGKFTFEKCEEKSKVKIKSSNSIYYANTLNSLWIPETQILSLDAKNRAEIDSIINDEDYVYNDLVKFARRNKISIEIINQYINEDNQNYISDIAYRQAEYKYFLNNQQTEYSIIKFRKINVEDQMYGFKELVKIDRLRKITVQTSFTRNEPIDNDSILIIDNNYEYQVKRQSVSKNSFDASLLPAIENYGEGILFVIDDKKLKQWEDNELIKKRIEQIQANAENSDWLYHKIEARTITARKVLIHTLSHLLIREFEYVCGYPMSSLQERLYVNDNMNGFLISAYDGMDGYLGGLTKLCNNLEKLQSIIKSSLQRAKSCSLDPICYESEGQGVAMLNLAACQSCTLIPDTSCEISNLFLDRQLVIDEFIGFFNGI